MTEQGVVLGVRDIVYILFYVVTVVAWLVSYRSRVKDLYAKYNALYRVIYSKRGTLNLIEQGQCSKNMNQIYGKIRDNEQTMRMAFEKIDAMNENIVKIMIHMKILDDREAQKILDLDTHIKRRKH